MLNVVITEDESLIRRALRKLIEEKNEQYAICYEAVNGQSALGYLTTHKADIIITDIRMPGLNGLELLKALNEKGISIKSIIISGYNEFEYARTALQQHVTAYLLKPIVPDELYSCLDTIAKSIEEEQINRNILITEKIKAIQKHFPLESADEINPRLFISSCLFAACASIEPKADNKYLFELYSQLENIFFPCCFFISDNKIYSILALDGIGKDRIESVLELKAFFTSHGITGIIGAGLPVSSIAEIHISIQQAQKALSYADSPAIGYVDYERLTFFEYNAANYPLAEEQQLLEAVIISDAEQITIYMEQFHYIIHHYPDDVEIQILAELSITCKRELCRYNPAISWDSLFTALTAAADPLYILSSLKDILLLYNSSIKSARGSSNTYIIEKAKQYISEHACGLITLDEVSDYCYLSKSYFCKLFKESTSMTFKSYLNNIRMNHAKELLVSSSLKNYEISQAVGIEDCSYFNDSFKKKYGMTPSEFKKTYHFKI